MCNGKRNLHTETRRFQDLSAAGVAVCVGICLCSHVPHHGKGIQNKVQSKASWDFNDFVTTVSCPGRGHCAESGDDYKCGEMEVCGKHQKKQQNGG